MVGMRVRSRCTTGLWSFRGYRRCFSKPFPPESPPSDRASNQPAGEPEQSSNHYVPGSFGVGTAFGGVGVSSGARPADRTVMNFLSLDLGTEVRTRPAPVSRIGVRENNRRLHECALTLIRAISKLPIAEQRPRY